MFSTRQGERSPRPAPHPARPAIARSNVKVDIVTYASVLRQKWPDVARFVKVPVNIGNYFDDYDLATEGSDFLSAVLETMSKENGHPVGDGKSRCFAYLNTTCLPPHVYGTLHLHDHNIPHNKGNLLNFIITFEYLFHTSLCLLVAYFLLKPHHMYHVICSARFFSPPRHVASQISLYHQILVFIWRPSSRDMYLVDLASSLVRNATYFRN
jgi:hypothetical protein